MRRLYLAPFGLHTATELVFKAALDTGAEPHEICYVTPSPRKLRDAQLRFIRLFGRRAFIPPTFTTPGMLSRNLHRRFGATRLFPSELGPLLVRSLLASHRPKPTIGYCAALAGFVNDVKLHFAADHASLVARLKKGLEGYDNPLARALEAAQVLQRYNELLHARGWADEPDIMLSAAVHVSSRLEPIRVLILDSFAAPNRPEQTLLAALINRAQTVLAMGYGDSTDSPDYALAARFTEFVASQSGFETVQLAAQPQPPTPLFACHSQEDEVLTICRHIRGNLWPEVSDTVLTFPRLNDYSPLIRRIFPQFGIPFTIYPETRLAASAPIVAVLELLRSVSSDFTRLATAAALSSPFLARLLQLDDSDGDFLRYSSAVNNYSKRAGIIKGRRNWQHLGQRLAAAEGLRPADSEATFVAGLEERIRSALKLAYGAFRSVDTLGSGARKLKELLGRIAFGAPAREQKPLRMLAPEQQQLYDLLDALVAFERDFGAIPADTAELQRVVARLASDSLVSNNPDPDGILVVPMTETLGLCPKHLLFGGLAENALPGRYSADPILPDRVRTALGMPDMSWHRDWQRFHLRRNLESASGTTFLTFPTSADGAPILPTPYLDLKPVPPPRTETLFSAREIQIAEGRRRRIQLPETEQPVEFATDREVQQVLAQRFGPDREIPVTALEAYRRCPFRFYLEHVLGLSTPDEPRFDVDARQWGLVAHRLLEKLYAGGAVPLERLKESAVQALDSTLDELNLPQFWQQVIRGVFANLLPGLVACERSLRKEGYTPQCIESRVRGEVAEGLRVKGRMDRLDSGPGGLRVLDYKTGSTAAVTVKAVLEDRTHVQLPLYARLIQSRGRIDNIGVYSLREPSIIWLANRTPVEELMVAAVENALDIAAGIRAGRFPPVATGEVCHSCELSHTCGMRRERLDSQRSKETEP